jgi:hypothetical protein
VLLPHIAEHNIRKHSISGNTEFQRISIVLEPSCSSWSTMSSSITSKLELNVPFFLCPYACESHSTYSVFFCIQSITYAHVTCTMSLVDCRHHVLNMHIPTLILSFWSLFPTTLLNACIQAAEGSFSQSSCLWLQPFWRTTQ